MAILIIISKNQNGKRRQFMLGASKLGAVLDMAHAVVEIEHNIISILLEYEGASIYLPLSIFNRQSFEASFNQLKGEWEQLLSHPSPNMSSQIELQIKAVQLRLDQGEKYIAFLESAIVKLELRLSLHAKDLPLSVRYQLLIDGYRRHLNNAGDRKEKNNQQLRALLK